MSKCSFHHSFQNIQYFHTPIFRVLTPCYSGNFVSLTFQNFFVYLQLVKFECVFSVCDNHKCTLCSSLALRCSFHFDPSRKIQLKHNQYNIKVKNRKVNFNHSSFLLDKFPPVKFLNRPSTSTSGM